MKKMFFTIAAFSLITTAAFCQEPTTLKSDNLKGNVFSVTFSQYEFKENFGEPVEGNLRWKEAKIYNEEGKAILFNQKIPNYGDTFFLVSYSKDGNKTKVLMSERNLVQWDSKYSDALELFTNNLFTAFVGRKREIEYDDNNVIIKYDVLGRSRPEVPYTLKGRKIAKPLGNGIYECKLYDSDGSTKLDYKETYNSHGILIDLDNEREFNNVNTGSGIISINHAGKYQYDNDGRLVTYTQQKRSYPETEEYIYNDHGDIEKINKRVNNNISGTITYKDYKYDEHGNWIYRVHAIGKQNYYIEKRYITYCNTTNEIKDKVNRIYADNPVTDTQKENELAGILDKFIGKRYEAEVPTTEYYPQYASIKGADELILNISFYLYAGSNNGKGSMSVVPQIPQKCSNKVRQLSLQLNTSKEVKYAFEGGIMTIDNEQYKVDTATGNIVNISRNITFKRNIVFKNK